MSLQKAISYPVVITSDLHFSSDGEAYPRFALFDYLRVQCEKAGAKTIMILGDLTHNKDRHNAQLVNTIVGGLLSLVTGGIQIIILRGNHDIETRTPFFAFLNAIPGIMFIDQLVSMNDFYFIPHTRDPSEFKALSNDSSPTQYIMCHQTFAGAIAENGFKLDGLNPIAATKRTVFCGDVHVPQESTSEVTGTHLVYVGSPYHVGFGKDFEPRIIVLHKGTSGHRQYQSIVTPFNRRLRLVVSTRSELLTAVKPRSGDEYLIEVRLTGTEDLTNLDAIKKQLAHWQTNPGIKVKRLTIKVGEGAVYIVPVAHSLSDVDVLSLFAELEDLPASTILKGFDILDRAQ